MRRIFNFLVSKPFAIMLMILAELGLLYYAVYVLSIRFQTVYYILVFLSLLIVVYLINRNDDPSYKLSWAIFILALPLFGGLTYLLFGGKKVPKALRSGVNTLGKYGIPLLVQNPQTLLNAVAGDPTYERQVNYILKNAYMPVYSDTEVEYYKVGEEMYDALLRELEKAESFIFMEYFIINRGVMWSSIQEVLVRKVKQGVDVRVLYDDAGSMRLPRGFDKELRKLGIKCHVFNPFSPILAIRMNNRDHRKICVIDGKTGFVSGINLADEYVNLKMRFGHWKDSAIMLKGEAVFSLTVMFLQFYNYLAKTNDDYFKYKADSSDKVKVPGYVQAFGDSPTDDELVCETTHLNMINAARRYIYIMTPYLVVDREMTQALITAAKSGIDVRIMVPHIPDKWYVFALTRDSYEELTKHGVRIFEYKPGFLHSKVMIIDDKAAIIGTSNLDYRSYYLHFECGVLILDHPVLRSVKDDFLDTEDKCIEVTYADCLKVNFFVRLGRAILKIFSALL
jgi:cardiolipin synthase